MGAPPGRRLAGTPKRGTGSRHGRRAIDRSTGWAVALATVAALPSVSLWATLAAASPLPHATAGAPLLDQAAASLLRGAGPAGGTPMPCQSSSVASLLCGGSSVPIPGFQAQNVSAPRWTDLTSHVNGTPPGRQLAVMADDPVLGRVILFGGLGDGAIPLGDTWAYSNGSWTYVAPMGNASPAPRWGAAMAFDPGQTPGQLLLFGGRNGTTLFNDTWRFTSTGWLELTERSAPSARSGAAMGFDPSESEVILFGGSSSLGTAGAPGPLNDTWAFRGDVWINLTRSLATAPPPLRAGSFVTDLAAGGLLLVGGSATADCAARSAEWGFHLGAWSNLSRHWGGAALPARADASLIADVADGLVVRFGGGSEGGGRCLVENDTWALAALNWTNMSGRSPSAPSPRLAYAAAYDSTDGYGLLFGGNLSGSGTVASDTWGYSARPFNWSGSRGSSNNSTSRLTALLQATPAYGVAPLTVDFSVRPAGGIPPYREAIEFGDGSAGATGGPNFTHAYASPGPYLAVVTVSDAINATVHAQQTVTVLASWQVAHQWVDLSNSTPVAPSVRSSAAMVYDPAVGAVLLFGGYSPSVVAFGDTWEYSHGAWSDLGAALAAAPPARWGAGIAYDAHDGFVVLFGGRNVTSLLNDTWTFDGKAWHADVTRAAPSARELVQMTYDAADGYVVLFGGERFGEPGGPVRELNDTWVYISGSWTNVTTAIGPAPPPTGAGAIAYDAHDGYVLLDGGTVATGGVGSCSATAAMWAYAHGRWTVRNGSVAPEARTGAVMVYDSLDAALVLFGGSSTTGGTCAFDAGTWSFTNGSWSDLSSVATRPPPGRCCGSIAFDAADGYAVLFGGNANGVYVNDTWSYGVAPLAAAVAATPTRGGVPLDVTFVATATGGTGPYTYNWSFGDGALASGPPSENHSYRGSGVFVATVTVADAAGRTTSRAVAIDVLSAWAAGHEWVDISSSTPNAPAARASSAVVFDPSLNAVVLFGGYSPYNFAFGDTWEFTNGLWTDLSSTLATAPPARWGAAIAYDARDGYIVLFGGRDVQTFYNDTWRFGGTGWVAIPTSTAPSPRTGAAMAFDARDDYVFLFGGAVPTPTGATAPTADSWTFAGGTWSNVTTTVTGTPPAPLSEAAVAYDPFDSYVLLVGGSTAGCSASNAAYAYAEGRWVPLGLGYGPSARSGAGLTFDGVDQSLLLFGGRVARPGCAGSNETWLYRNASWENLSGAIGPAPTPRADAGVAFDAADDVVLLFGGDANGVYTNDTWVYPAAPTNGSCAGCQAAKALTVTATASARNGTAPFAVTFTAVSANGEPPVTFTWSFGDGSPFEVGPRVVHTYTSGGTFTPTVLAVDAVGAQVTRSLPAIHIAPAAANPNPPPSPALRIPFLPGSSTAIAFAIGFAAGNAALVWLLVTHYRKPRGGGRQGSQEEEVDGNRGEATSGTT